MDKYLDKIHSIISDARLSIKEEGLKALKDVKDEEEQKRIKIASIHYEIMLSEMLLYKDEIESKINDQVKFVSNKGTKIVLDEDPGIKEDLSIENYAYEGEVGAFVSDEEPIVVETKSGKKIVLDEDPAFYITKTGKKIELADDPKFKKDKTNNRIVLDEDPVSIKTKSGKKIILDEDPVSNKLKSNKVIVLSEDPFFRTRKTGKVFKLDDDPIKRHATRIELDEDPINFTIEDDDYTDDEVTIEFDKLV